MLPAKKESPSAERNKHPIWDVLQTKVFPQTTHSEPLRILEIAAGAGIHTQFFAKKLLASNVSFRWTPTDMEPSSLSSISAYIHEDPNELLSTHIDEPIQLTLESDGIREEATRALLEPQSVDVIIAINLIHISPWSATLGLLKTAGTLLKDNGKLYLYGPYRVDGTCVESNVRFEEWLQSLDRSYGLRNLEDVIAAAESEHLDFVESIEMPANNLSVLFQKRKA